MPWEHLCREKICTFFSVTPRIQAANCIQWNKCIMIQKQTLRKSLTFMIDT